MLLREAGRERKRTKQRFPSQRERESTPTKKLKGARMRAPERERENECAPKLNRARARERKKEAKSRKKG